MIIIQTKFFTVNKNNFIALSFFSNWRSKNDLS